MFSSPLGEKIYRCGSEFLRKYSLEDKLSSGVLVGFSGGADSVMLALFLCEYQERNAPLPLLLFHVNHGIRGEEAERDERFSRELSEELGVEFDSLCVDVPKIAKERGVGTEEAARDVRYSAFDNIIRGRNDISLIALAHNATDNIETVLLNILRGSGSRGASGIPPVRGNIFRPLLSVPKEDIVSLLTEYKIPFVTDSTNLSTEYRRNYLRGEVLPLLRNINPSIEAAFSRLSDNLRSDDDCLSSLAEEFLSGRETVPCRELSALHGALLARVLSLMAGESLSYSQNSKLSELLSGDNFSYTVRDNKIFYAERGLLSVKDGKAGEEYTYSVKIGEGRTKIEELNLEITVTHEPVDKTSLNIYKKSIQAQISDDIIDGEMLVRPKDEGDTVYYGGMTRKLKKLFSDRKIPPSERKRIPVLCDGKGVLWLPGYGIRCDGKGSSSRKVYVTMGVYSGESDSDAVFGSEYK